MSENVVSPNGSGLTSIRGRARESAARHPRCGHRGFRESDFFSYYFLKQSKAAISDRIEIFSCTRSCQGIRQQDHATHETLELAERESPFDWALHSHCRRGDRVSRRRALGAHARSLLGSNRDSGSDAIHSRRYDDALRRAHRCHRRWRVSRSARDTNLAAFMLAIFFIGLLSFGFRLERTAYRYASVTLTIIVLIPRTNPAWIVALHRFIEVSVGIVVALAVVAFWPERSAIAAKNADQ